MSGPCCAAGEIHQGTPTGKVTKIHGLDCYVADPSEGKAPKGVVVILPDVFGWELPNSRILADNYAKKGEFLVYLPEFMAGERFLIECA
jgi:dienelactone hydrolase